MKRAQPETSRGTSGDAAEDFSASAVGPASNDSDRTPRQGGEAGVNHLSSSTFEAWLAGYRRRLEQFVKNAGRK